MGPGPNEFTWVEDMFWTLGDSMVIVDSGNQRVTVFSADGAVARSLRSPVQMVNTIVDKWPQRVIASGHIASPSSAGLPLHVLDLSGSETRVVSSFGPDGGLLRPRGGGATFQFLARGVTGTLLSIGSDRYRVHAWSGDSREQWSLSRSSSWFPDTGAARLGTPDRAPTPGINGISTQGRVVWVFARIAAPTWKDGWGKIPPGTREVFRSQIDFPALYQTRVEAIDADQGVLLARLDLSGVVVSVLEDGLISVFRRTTGAADPSVEILKLTLNGWTSARR